MAVLKIAQYPSAILAKKAKTVTTIGKEEQQLIQDMIETMYHDDGVGLAAPQVGVSKQIIVISPRAHRGEERVLINPVITESSGEEVGLEGCLSLPGISGEVRRATKIKFQALDPTGAHIVETAQAFTARVIQHEIDHLNGILLIDRVDFNKRQELLSAYQRL